METHGEVFGARMVAYIADSVIIGIVTGVLVFALALIGFGIGGENGGAGAMVLLLPLMGILWFGYFIYFEGNSGQTPGKKLMDIMVVKDDGSYCDYAASGVRNVLRIVDQLGIFIPYLVALAVMYVTDKSQRIGDKAASTVVVRTR